jgi:hypothetical protein
MKFRSHQTLWLAFWLVSCDESKKTSESPQRTAVTPRTTKSVRATAGEPLPSHQLPDSAMVPPEEMTTADERNQALSTAAWDAIETDPDLALKTVQQMATGSEEKNRLLAHFAMRLADHDTDEAIRWASALTTDEEKSLALGKIALVLSVKEPERAAQLLSESGIPGRDFDVAVVQVVQRWAATSPADAAAWLSLFSAGEARSAGLAEVVSVWIRQNAAEAFAWIPSIPDPILRQEAERGAAKFILNEPEISQNDFLKSANAGTLSQLELLKSRLTDEDD